MMIKDWLDGRRNGPLPKYIIFFVVCILFFGGIYLGILWLGSSTTTKYERENANFHTLPAAPYVLVDSAEKIVINDVSTYAQDETLALAQYTEYSYSGDLLTGEADYDKDGFLTSQSAWVYDTAGNLIEERVKNGTDEQTRRYLYEYDDAGNVVHRRIYLGKAYLGTAWEEDDYFRYTDIGCAGYCYSYDIEQKGDDVIQTFAGGTEFLEDNEGRLQCMFHLDSLETTRPSDACTGQWAQREKYLLNRMRYYEDSIWMSDCEDWYQTTRVADAEQCNVYDSDFGNRVLQVNYEWDDDELVYCLAPSFYQARYDGGLLLWQMTYEAGVLAGCDVCKYDADGRLQEGVAYRREEEPHAVCHRFVYPQKDQTQKYSYEIQGRTFTQPFGEGESVSLSFSDTGILTEMKLTDAAGAVSKEYQFSGGIGGSAGMLENETDYLKELETEAAAYGFRVGEDLEDSVKGSAE